MERVQPCPWGLTTSGKMGGMGSAKLKNGFVGVSGTTENNWLMASISEAKGVGGMRARPPEVTAITSGVWIYMRQSVLCPC
jgi:hypothetical protein